MKTNWCLSLVAVVWFCCGCKSNNDLLPSEGGSSGPFSVSISVTDSLLHPVSGLRISVLTGLAGVQAASLSPVRLPLYPLSATSMGFDLAAPARITFTVLDMNNRPVASVADQTIQNSGSYVFAWSFQQNLPTRVFKCRLVARDTTSGAVLFTDSNYAVLWQRDAMLAVVGSTSASGTFECRDSLLFPNVLTLPPLVMTAATGPTPLGEFSVRDTVTLVLTDTVLQRSQSYHTVIVHGENTISLIWAPSAPSTQTTGGEVSRTNLLALTGPRNIVTWKLWQNYPNPFD